MTAKAEQLHRRLIRAIYSPDYFLHRGAAARPVRCLRFYDPHLAPCANPFLSGRAV